ncbi:MAG: phosphoribosyl-AMP cyclohydrolase [Pseudomonadota bacterium]
MAGNSTPLYHALESAPAGTERTRVQALDALRYNDAGLIPAIAQDHETGEVLMLAWMNRAALDATLDTGRVTYYSRSRAELWRKGGTSGHTQRLISLTADCDGDAVLLKIEQTGAACHTFRRSCFYNEIDATRLRVCTGTTQEAADDGAE